MASVPFLLSSELGEPEHRGATRTRTGTDAGERAHLLPHTQAGLCRCDVQIPSALIPSPRTREPLPESAWCGEARAGRADRTEGDTGTLWKVACHTSVPRTSGHPLLPDGSLRTRRRPWVVTGTPPGLGFRGRSCDLELRSHWAHPPTEQAAQRKRPSAGGRPTAPTLGPEGVSPAPGKPRCSGPSFPYPARMRAEVLRFSAPCQQSLCPWWEGFRGRALSA